MALEFGIALAALALAVSCPAASLTWTGGGTTGNWSDSANWGFQGVPANGDYLTFPSGAARLTNTNNLTDLRVASITFGPSAVNYYIFGNAITVSNGIDLLYTTGNNSFYPSITLGGSQSWDFTAAGGSGGFYHYGEITLGTNRLTLNNNGYIWLYDALGTTGGITKTGTNTVRFGGNANTYTGTTYVNEGTVELALGAYDNAWEGPVIIGDGTGNAATVRLIIDYELPNDQPVTIRSDGLLDLHGLGDGIGALTMIGGRITNSGNAVLLVAGDVAATNSSGIYPVPAIYSKISLNGADRRFAVLGDLYLYDRVSDGGIIKAGSGNMRLLGTNTYAGLTVVQGGWLSTYNPWSLGTTNLGTVVSNGATLVLEGLFGITNEALTLNGVGMPSWGALDTGSTSGTNLWVGPITVNADSTFYPYNFDAHLHIIGPISGPGGITQYGSGTMYFEGNAANNYAGTTYVTGGTLVLGKSVSNVAMTNDLIVGDGIGGANADVVRVVTTFQLPETVGVTVNSSGRIEFNVGEAFGSLAGSGTVTLNAGVSVGGNNRSTLFSGIINGTGSFSKYGSGTMTLSGNNTYAGQTTVTGGSLLINGSQPQSTVYVYTTLGGSGTVGNIYSYGNLSPGASPGILTCSNLYFYSGTYYVDLNGLNPGTGYDQLNVRGTNLLGGALQLAPPAFSTPAVIGDQFVILNNDGAELVGGTFAGVPDGATINAGGYAFRINYGNDVVLTLLGVPCSQGISEVTAGNGNHAIEPNECNDLRLAIVNNSATPMTGVTATLSTPSMGVMITQPYSDYPDVPAGGSETNSTPFQITTLPGFACGAPVNIELIVNSASHGSFVVPMLLSSGAPESSPSRYDVGTLVNIPDIGTIESTNAVAGFTGPLSKVAVSLFLTHPYDGDLDISLINPDGVIVDLSSGNGGISPNFGSACSPDGSRTTFDDAAPISITAGAPPFIGSFRPEVSLATLIGGAVNGNWRLRVTDNYGGSVGALRCWSLFLYETDCTPGSGFCDVCLPPIAGAIAPTDGVQTNRAFRDFVIGSCGTPKPWYDFGDVGPSYHYDVYTFTNTTDADACVTVRLQSTNAVMAVAYLGSFDPNNITNNYLGDSGSSTDEIPDRNTTFSCSVPAGARFLVVVNEVTQNSGTLPYTLSISGLPCPPPTLAIERADTNKVRLFWPTSAAGCVLEAIPSLTSGLWIDVTNEPIVHSGKYNVTNTITPSSRFYRLYKEQ